MTALTSPHISPPSLPSRLSARNYRLWLPKPSEVPAAASLLVERRVIARLPDVGSTLEVYAHRLRITPSMASKREHADRLAAHRNGDTLMAAQSRGGGVRGKVKGLSEGAKGRLMNKVLAWHDVPNVFLTLTYPDEPSVSPKRDLDVFKKRLARRYPDVTGIWRLELVPRKSGALVGVYMPHYHLLLHVPDNVDYEAFKAFAANAWHETARRLDWSERSETLHARRGTDCQRVRSPKGAISYASKYIAKVDRAAPLEAGRLWGLVGKPNMTRLAVIELPRLWRDTLARKVCRAIAARAPRSKGIRSVLYYRRWAWQSVNAYQYGSRFGQTVLQLTLFAKRAGGDGLQVIPSLLR